MLWEPLQPAECAPCREVATHPVHSTARWRRRRADEEPWVRGGVGVESRHRPGEELPEIGDAARDRAAHIVGVLVLELARSHGAPRENAVAESRSEALDLTLDD